MNAALGRIGAAATQPTASVFRFNENTRFPGAPRFETYALAYTSQNKGAVCAGAMAATVVFMRDPRPVEIYPDKIAGCAAAHTFPLDTLMAFVLAHETGHRLGLSHYLRGAQYNGGIAPPFTSVNRNEYVVDPANPTQLYNRPAISQEAGGIRLLDHIVMTGSVLVGNQYIEGSAVLVGTPTPNAVTWPVRFPLVNPVSITSSMGTVFFEVIRRFIMDYTASYEPSMSSPASWLFSPSSPDDLLRMCVSCNQ